MNRQLPIADISPRIVNGVIHWYMGDIFDIRIKLDMIDQDGTPIRISPDETVKVLFRDKKTHDVKEFEFTDIEDNTVTLDFDEDTTELFESGEYTYDIYLISEDQRVTISNNNIAEVEE